LKIRNSLIIVITLTSVLSSELVSQTLSNLEVINSLVDLSAKGVSSTLQNNSETFRFENNTPTEYSALNERVISALTKNSVKINNDSSHSNKISYIISHAGVEYSDIFRDGMFGEYLLERKFFLSGNYVVAEAKTVVSSDSFDLSKTDTVSYSNISFIENSSLPFTQANVPSEPFLPSIVEPVIVITAVAVTIILFFTVRTK